VPSIVTSRCARSSMIGPTASTSSPIARVPQHRPDPAAQLRQPERLGHIVIGTRLEAQDRVGLGAKRGEHDDRHDVAPSPQRPADLTAVGPGPGRDVDQDDLELVGGNAVDRRAAVGHRLDAMALAAERARQHLAQIRLVIDDEDAQRRVRAARRGMWRGRTFERHPRTIVARARDGDIEWRPSPSPSESNARRPGAGVEGARSRAPGLGRSRSAASVADRAHEGRRRGRHLADESGPTPLAAAVIRGTLSV
jgi:hypothetical protein